MLQAQALPPQQTEPSTFAQHHRCALIDSVTWNTFFARSMPTVAIFVVDAPLGQWLMTLPLWHVDAVTGGGVHPIAFGGRCHWGAELERLEMVARISRSRGRGGSYEIQGSGSKAVPLRQQYGN